MLSTDQAETDAWAHDPRIEDLLGKMTLLEKVAMLSGRDIWYTVPIPRLGIPSLVMTDGPHGVRASNPETGRPVGPTTCFPDRRFHGGQLESRADRASGAGAG